LRVLLAEDDSSLGAFVKLGLEQEGFDVDWVTNGLAADQGVAARPYDVIVLDLGLPGVDGETLLRQWCGRAQRIPTIVLTGRGLVPDRVRLLNLGADDYLVKPFDLFELCARMRAVLRRSAAQDGAVLEFGALKLLPKSQVAFWNGNRVDLTDGEFCLLEKMLRNTDQVFSRRVLEESLYGQASEVGSNTVEVHVHNLRRKLARDLIQTVRGKGYRLSVRPYA